jgi:hypothetical protein
MASTKRAVGILCIGAALLVLGAVPASADVVDPDGACTAAGQWQDEGVTRASPDFSSDDIIEIPQQDTILWAGGIGDAAPGTEGPRREISGEIEVDIAGVGTAKIDDWGGSSVKLANNDEHEYDVPDVLLNVKMNLHGEHREAAEGSSDFKKICSGSVYLQVKAGRFENPLSLAALVLMVVFGISMVSAGIVKKA